MTNWTSDELNRIGPAKELAFALLRRDSTALNAVPIWVVRVNDGLYIRSYRRQGGAWFRAAQISHAGHIRAGGVEKEVTVVEESDPGANDQIDAAYHIKYHRYPQYVAPMVTAEVRTTTIQRLLRML